MKKIRIIHVIAALGNGGIENMLKNYYQNINKDEIEFDFIVHNANNRLMEQFFLDNNSKIFYVTPKKVSLIKNFIESRNIIKSGNYDIIHCHQAQWSLPMLFLAKIYKIPIRILHIHVMIKYTSKIKKLYTNALIKANEKLATNFCACSNLAGKSFFNNNWNLQNEKCYLMRNAVNINKFKYNEEKRKEYRNRYDCNDKTVLLYVGRIEREKNLDFILEMYRNNPEKEKYKIIFVGNGNYRNYLEEYTKDNNKYDVCFIDSCINVEDYYSMSDIFLFPSFSEGLGMVAIEAQLNGLPVLASKNISNETDLGNIEYLEYNIDEWNKMLDIVSRKSFEELKNASRYDINYESKIYEKYIRELVR